MAVADDEALRNEYAQLANIAAYLLEAEDAPLTSTPLSLGK